jgi:opacity protein-like surface antigen
MNRRALFICVVALLLSLFCGSAFAQSGPTGVGSIMMSTKAAFSSKGGELYSGYDDDDSERTLLFSGSGSLDIFVLPGVALGAQGLIETQSYEDFSEVTWGIGPEAWLFIGGSHEESPAGSFYPFLTAGLLYTSTTMKMSIDWPEIGLSAEDQESTDTLMTMNIGGGICYMITNTIGFVLEINYELDKAKFGSFDDFDGSDDHIEGNKFNVLAGISAFIH